MGWTLGAAIGSSRVSDPSFANQSWLTLWQLGHKSLPSPRGETNEPHSQCLGFFFMLSTKSFIQTTITPPWTYSTGRFGGSSEKKRNVSSAASLNCCALKKKNIYIQMSEFSEDNRRTSEHSRWLQFKILQLNHRYFANISFKKWKAHSTTIQLFPSHVFQEETIIVLQKCFRNTFIKKTRGEGLIFLNHCFLLSQLLYLSPIILV